MIFAPISYELYIVHRYRVYLSDGSFDIEGMEANRRSAQKWGKIAAQCGWNPTLPIDLYKSMEGTLTEDEIVTLCVSRIFSMRNTGGILLCAGWRATELLPMSVGCSKEYAAAQLKELWICENEPDEAITAHKLRQRMDELQRRFGAIGEGKWLRTN